MREGAAPHGGTTVGPDAGEEAFVRIGFPLLGAAAGGLLKALTGWLTSQPWVPFHGLFKLIDSLPDPYTLVVLALAGAGAGRWVAVQAERDYVRVTVDNDRLSIVRGDQAQTIPRQRVDAVFVDGNRLVLLDHGGDEVASQAGDIKVARLAVILSEHGYRWLPDGDPYSDDYRRWLDGMPDLSTAANVVLKARAQALEKRDERDAAELRDELCRLGIIVRDRDKRQYWRQIDRGRAPDSPPSG